MINQENSIQPKEPGKGKVNSISQVEQLIRDEELKGEKRANIARFILFGFFLVVVISVVKIVDPISNILNFTATFGLLIYGLILHFMLRRR